MRSTGGSLLGQLDQSCIRFVTDRGNLVGILRSVVKHQYQAVQAIEVVRGEFTSCVDRSQLIHQLLADALEQCGIDGDRACEVLNGNIPLALPCCPGTAGELGLGVGLGKCYAAGEEGIGRR